ncbi:MAG: GMC oxidoreductase [Microthrixaceae bacterium]|nr:GMC oxidoreductase [Microthrixaceae bacterium]
MEDAAFDRHRGEMLIRYERDDPAQIEATLRDHADTEYHPCGTARMGPDGDPTAVVDPRLRVKGIDGLRIADAPVMPVITSNNIHAPVIHDRREVRRHDPSGPPLTPQPASAMRGSLRPGRQAGDVAPRAYVRSPGTVVVAAACDG